MPSTFREVAGAAAAVRITPINQTTHVVTGSGTFYTIQKAKISETSGTGDTTNFESGGFGEDVATILRAELELVQASYDGTLNLFITPNAVGPQIKFMVEIWPDFVGNAASLWTFPVVLCTNRDHEIDALNLQPVTIKAKSIGSYTWPT
jgi:hypothetical protein